MHNLHSAGTEPYEAAAPLPKKSVWEWLFGLLWDLVNLVRFLVLSLPIWGRVLRDFVMAPPEKNISGQVAVITGGGNGLGRAIAIRLAKQGVHIGIADVDLPAAERVAGDCRSFGVNARAYKCDVAEYDQLKRLSVEVEQDLGPADILINNAGLIPALSFREGNPQDIERILRVNVTSNIWVSDCEDILS